MKKDRANELLLLSQEQLDVLFNQIKEVNEELRRIRQDFHDEHGNDLIRASKVCKMLDVSSKTLDEHIRKKNIEPVVQTGHLGSRYFFRSDVLKFQESLRSQQSGGQAG